MRAVYGEARKVSRTSAFFEEDLDFFRKKCYHTNNPYGCLSLVLIRSFLLMKSTIDDMAEQFLDQQFLEYVVKSIVNHPDDVHVERIVDERGVLLTLHVNPEDMGYVIGRSGQMAHALRILLKGVGAKANARVNMKIYEPEDARREHQERRAAAPVAAPEARHGEAGLVSDADLSDIGI